MDFQNIPAPFLAWEACARIVTAGPGAESK